MSDMIVTDVRTSPARESFLALARRVFGLDFAPWNAQGYWTDRYRPYAVVRDGQVVANVSVNRIDTRVNGIPKRFIQLGTVMTHPDFRGQGLARRAMEAALADHRDACDVMYLYANDSVLDFYPRFGFERAQEHVHSALISPCAGDFAPLDMDKPESIALLRRLYEQGNPYSALPMLKNWGLMMFYCGAWMKESVFYSSRRSAACIAEQEGDTLVLHDVLGTPELPLPQLAAEIAAPGTNAVTLGFTPVDESPFACAPLCEEDTTLFVLSGKENPFARRPIRMPSLSRA